MKNTELLTVALIATSLAVVNVVAAQDDNPISTQSSEPLLPDPVQGQGANYPPSAVTADAAYSGPPKEIPRSVCSPLNPCAAASSAPRKLGPLLRASE